MRKIFICGISSVLLLLTACSAIAPKTVTVNGIKYRSGFYGDLYPINMTYGEETYTVRGNEFHPVDCDRFEWLHSSAGDTVGGTIYCEESQWEEANAYYTDAENFTYFCKIGVENTMKGTEPTVIELSEIDPEQFKALMDFAADNSYDPFRQKKNAGVETVHLPIPDSGTSPQLVFYKESNDGFFVSDKGYLFHIVDGTLLLVFYYDYGHGEYEELVAVEVPAKLGQYFINLTAPYTA